MIQEVTVKATRLQVIWSGKLEANDAKDIQENLIEYINKGYSAICIDLSALDYIDYHGVGVLLSIHKIALQNGIELEVKGQHGMVKELFRLIRLDKVFGKKQAN